MSEDHIKVVCRVRPANARESSSSGQARTCITIPENSNTVVLNAKPESKSFTFDYAADANVTQDNMFQLVGLPITESCLQGYNGTILCYGQTGSGKTYTIFGNALDRISSADQLEKEPLRGLVPRVLGHLWETFAASKAADETYRFNCKCSFYEIYQERVFDLLDMAGSQNPAGLSVREDAKEGVYVEGCTEEDVATIAAAHDALVKGYQNRHVAETNMNRESSRSHAVFQLSLETSTERPADGIVIKRKARFSMVDLAGSERQKDTNATGERLKEASVINKSLSTLGHVINTLADIASNGGRKHIHYRDSKLTFLLRDSLGGNSKTTLVATLSPAEICLAETLSTLKFAQRAKSIRNSAVLNEESSGSIQALQREIALLKARLSEEVVGSNLVDPVNTVATKNVDGSLTSSLLEAVRRCELAEEQRIRADAKAAALNQQLDQSKSSVMGVKYMLKMRESEISRLKKKSTDPVDESVNTEELLKAATNAVKDELQGEIVKLRLEVKEQRAIIQDLNTNFGDKKWTPDNEISFNHSLRAILEANCASMEELKRQSTSIAEGKFAEEFGFSPSEAAAMKQKLSVTESRLEEALTRLPQLQHGVVLLQRMLDEANGSAEELRHQLEAEKIKSEALPAAQAMIEELKRDIGEKDDLIQQLEGGMKKTDSELKEQMRLREGEFKGKMNLVMKDNAILLKRCRELEAAVAEFQVTLDVAVKSREAQKILVENSRLQILDMEKKFAEKTNAINEESKAQCEVLTAANDLQRVVQSDLINRVAELESSLQQSAQELAQTRFEAENAVEDADNLFSQTQALIDERQCLLTNLTDSQNEVTQLKKQLEEGSAKTKEMELKLVDTGTDHTSAIAELNRTIFDLEQQLSSSQGNAHCLEESVRSMKEYAATFDEQLNTARTEMEQKLNQNFLHHEVLLTEQMVKLNEAHNAKIGQMQQISCAKIDALVESAEIESRDRAAIQRQADEWKVESLASEQRALEAESELVQERQKMLDCTKYIEQLKAELLLLKQSTENYNLLAATAIEVEAARNAALDLRVLVDQLNSDKIALQKQSEEDQSMLAAAKVAAEEANTERRDALQKLSELQLEHAALCGHQNNKQKIHQHMTLKKDLQDKALLLTQQQEQLVQLTFERDAARADAARLRKAMRTVEATSAPGDSSIASIKKMQSIDSLVNRTTDENVENIPEHGRVSEII